MNVLSDRSTVLVKVTREEMETSPDPASIIYEKVIAGLNEQHGYDSAEIEWVGSSPVLEESVREAYRTVHSKLNRTLGKPREEVAIRVPFERPANRGFFDREREVGK
jgi:hypothetical protein